MTQGQGRGAASLFPLLRFPSGVKLRGHLKRPSDGAEPEKIAWIQCVGSRDAARQALEAYKNDGAEVHMFLEADKYLVYSRRQASAASSTD